MIERVVIGFVIASVIAVAARRVRALSSSGAAAATLVGTACIAAGWRFGILLIVYFVTSSALSHFRHTERERLTGGVVEKGGARDALQVVANGGIFACLALASAWLPEKAGDLAALAALGALSAATADTWGTEIGTLFGGAPRSVLTFRTVAPGTSGGVTLAGTMATLAGSAFIGYGASLLGIGTVPAVVFVAGTIGAFIDSLLGATVQARRWCASCELVTERLVHPCGTVTSHSGGLIWLSNDAVNLLATLGGAAVAVLGLTI